MPENRAFRINSPVRSLTEIPSSNASIGAPMDSAICMPWATVALSDADSSFQSLLASLRGEEGDSDIGSFYGLKRVRETHNARLLLAAVAADSNSAHPQLSCCQ